ncbi:MAG: aspartyl protease family protein [Chitinophagaceae bacterium]|jgi:hypothetical protein|nr:aspartyl protease family protein [Chitinophagaceae bacterium]MCA6494235.1 aspartyl protease family protein [Chitinophagaceae bacterium]MCA6498951.1 aspartyl protease family protein [Chitinophagaceae bacterium]
MKFRWVWVLAGLLCSGLLRAQEEFVQPQAAMITRFPFYQLGGGIIILQGLLSGKTDTLNFVLDTGSGGISLDSGTVDRLKLPSTPSGRIIRGLNGLRQVNFVLRQTLRLPGLEVENLDFHVNDYELLSRVYGLRIDGIIGFSFLRRYIVKVDFEQEMLEVFTPGSLKYPRGGYLLKPQFTTLPMQPVFLNDHRPITGRFIFDTGAGLNMLLSEEFVSDSSVFKKGRVFYATQAEGLGGKKQMTLSLLKELRVGNYKFKNVPVHIFSDDYNVTNYPQMGGLIGNDIMRRFNMIINYPDQIIHIRPNRYFIEPFDYSYTGLAFYLFKGQVRVEDIMAGSPAEKAGFQPGDIIFSVDKTITRDIRTYRSMFQNSLGRVAVMVIREGKPLVLTLDVQDIRKSRRR